MPTHASSSVQRSSPKGRALAYLRQVSYIILAAAHLQDTKSPKAGQLRLIPLSLEPRSKDNGAEKLKLTPTQKKGLNSQKPFEGQHVAVFFDKRPISEQFSQEMISNKLTKKISFKAYGDWLEKNTKKPVPFKPTIQPQASMDVTNSPPSHSRFKAKILTARAKEDNITNELKSINLSRKDSYKEYPSIDISDSGSLKRGGMYVPPGLNPTANLEVSKFHGLKASHSSRTFDSSSVGKKSDNASSKELKSVESILLHSTVSQRKSQVVESNMTNKEKDLTVNCQTDRQQNSEQDAIANTPSTQPSEEAQPQPPRKLFQRNGPAARPPMLFMQNKAGVSFGNRVPSPNVVVDRPQSKESNKKEEEVAGKGKPPMKKDNFNGVITIFDK